MAFSVEWSIEAAEDFSKLERQLQERIRDKIKQAAENPQHYFEKLAGSDYYKLRVGDHRIIAMVLSSEAKIFIRKIGHRKNVYER